MEQDIGLTQVRPRQKRPPIRLKPLKSSLLLLTAATHLGLAMVTRMLSSRKLYFKFFHPRNEIVREKTVHTPFHYCLCRPQQAAEWRFI